MIHLFFRNISKYMMLSIILISCKNVQKNRQTLQKSICLSFLQSFYNISARSSSALFGLKYVGAISNTVLHPVCPSLCRQYAALAYARITEEVNSGLESSFRLYSIRCLFSFSQPVTPLLSTNPPCGIPL